MKQTFGLDQDELGYAYEHWTEIMEAHSDRAEKHKKRLDGIPHYTNINDAIQAFLDLEYVIERKKKPWIGRPFIWAKVGKDEARYYIQDYFIVTDDNQVHQAAEYVGMVILPHPSFLESFMSR